ncbi:porin family protein [Geofilum rubicundum]|nr:porin family protein [Geofilum rubicundum]
MKKKIALLFMFGMAFGLIQAQSFQLGIKTGFNSTSFDTDAGYGLDKVKDEFKSGYLIGGWTRIGLLGNLSVQPELYYSKKSGATDFETRGSESFSYYSWDIPLLAHLEVIDLKLLKIYGVGGPVASFRAKDESTLSIASVDFDYDGEDFKSTNWNFQLGAGVQLMRFTLDARYEWGLNDMSHTDMDRKSKSLIFALGYRLF